MDLEKADRKESNMEEKSCGYWGRLRFELGLAMFDTREPNGSSIDIRSTFVSEPRVRTGIFRAFVVLGTLSYFFWCWLVYFPFQNRGVFLAFLTKWTLMLTLLYQILSLACTIWPETILRQSRPNLHPAFRIMWILYSALLPLSCLVVITYWSFMGASIITLEAVMDHGVTFALLLIDGMILHRFPIRIKHIVLTYAVYFAYQIFYLVYDLGIRAGNGAWEWEPEGDESSLYPELNWRSHWKLSLVLYSAGALLFIPAVFFLFWSASLFSGCWKFDGSHRKLVSKGGSRVDSIVSETLRTEQDFMLSVSAFDLRSSLDIRSSGNKKPQNTNQTSNSDEESDEENAKMQNSTSKTMG